MDANDCLEQLNALLRGELAAATTYRRAARRVEDESLKATLADCQRSHEQRAAILRQQVEQLGGVPARSPGPWSAYRRAIRANADSAAIEAAAIAALEQCEAVRSRAYRDLSSLDDGSRFLIQQEVVPLQRQTHEALASLNRRAA